MNTICGRFEGCDHFSGSDRITERSCHTLEKSQRGATVCGYYSVPEDILQPSHLSESAHWWRQSSKALNSFASTNGIAISRLDSWWKGGSGIFFKLLSSSTILMLGTTWQKRSSLDMYCNGHARMGEEICLLSTLHFYATMASHTMYEGFMH